MTGFKKYSHYNFLAGYHPATSAAMINSGIANDSTIYYLNTPQQITGNQIWTAVNQYVLGLESINAIQPGFINFSNLSLSRMKRITLRIGGTHSSHKTNLVSPGTFDLTYHGTVISGPFGDKPDGVTGYADSGLNPSTVLTLNNTCQGYYVGERDDTNPCFVMGSRNGSNVLALQTKGAATYMPQSFQYSTGGAGFLQGVNAYGKLMPGGNIIHPTKIIFHQNYLGKIQIGYDDIITDETSSLGASLPNANTWDNGFNLNGVLSSPTTERCILSFEGLGMTQAAWTAFNIFSKQLQRDLFRYPTCTNSILDGDSIIWGQSTPNVTTPGTQYQSLFSLPSNVICTNRAVSGRTLETMIAQYPTNIRPYFFSRVDNNIYTIEGGVNDLGQQPSTTKEMVVARALALVTLGYNDGADVFLSTIAPQSNPAYSYRTEFENERQWINNEYRTTLMATGMIKGIVDYGADPLLGYNGAQFTPYYLQNTNIHWSDLGNARGGLVLYNAHKNYYGSNI